MNCPVCNGTGRQKYGTMCSVCEGTGSMFQGEIGRKITLVLIFVILFLLWICIGLTPPPTF